MNEKGEGYFQLVAVSFKQSAACRFMVRPLSQRPCHGVRITAHPVTVGARRFGGRAFDAFCRTRDGLIPLRECSASRPDRPM
jgi:hypothetical protein